MIKKDSRFKSTSKLVFAFLLAVSSVCTAQTDDPWADLPVSLNGELPDAASTSLWKEGLEKVVWHNCISTSQRLRNSWDASNFFDDPKVVQLCVAIFRGDVEEMETLIEDGVDVNAKGDGGMNPLYWAFHLNTNPRPFGCLLKHGADPNVIVDMSGRDEIQAVYPGYSVTNLSARGLYNRHFKTVFENGGDPNLMNECVFKDWQAQAFFEVWACSPDYEERLKLLVEKGADLNVPSPRGVTFLIANSGSDDRRCGHALIALNVGGADHRVAVKSTAGEYSGCYLRAIHQLVLGKEKIERDGCVDDFPKFLQLVARLEELGESMDEASKDLARWKKWVAAGQTDLIEQEYQSQKMDSENK
ncbi:hypothetical protein OAG68_02400 [bacterium]|nr:hypothetical protein [bacterium]